MKKIYNADTIKIMSLFGSVTKTDLKDCFEDKHKLLNFIVNQGDIGKAVGKKASNVKRIEKMLNRKIKIVEFNSDVLSFIRNLIYPLNARNIREGEEEGIVIIESQDIKTRGLLIGRNASNLRNIEAIAKKYYSTLVEIKVT